MHLHIAPKDGTPIYLQIVRQVKQLVAAGRLRPHEEMPPVRALAAQLLINPNTVARAYRDLEAAGVLYSRPGAATYVAEGKSLLADEERRRLLTERADALLVEADHLNYATKDTLALVKERYDALKQGKEDHHE